MIKYVIKTGSRFLNNEARDIRDFAYKPSLKGMHCKKCKTDTIIKFSQTDSYRVKTKIHWCCEYFGNRLYKKLNPNR